MRREQRSVDDGYRCELVPGLRSSQDAGRLAREIGFAAGRLLGLESSPPGVYGEIRACADVEEATWTCFLAAYVSPLNGEDPFAGIEQAARCSWASGEAPNLQGVPLGPRTSHDPARGAQTIVAYRRFAEHAGSQRAAFAGEPEWSAQRRFERAFERLSLPGFGRGGRFELLVTLGRLGLYELHADSLHVSAAAGARGPGMAARGAGTAANGAEAGGGQATGEDRTVAAAKRVFGIGDALNIERRAAALAAAAEVPLEALEPALWNWGSPEQERATMGFPPATVDAGALQRASAALAL